MSVGSRNVFREVNERILELGPPAVGVVDLVCECSVEHCVQLMTMSPDDYDAVRSEPGLWAVLPGHEQHEPGEVVRRTDQYVLVKSLDAPTKPEAVPAMQ
jgi:hypothetical protein